MKLKAKGLLLTGATGSFGKAFVSSVLESNSGIERLVIYSRDELKQWEMQQVYPQGKYKQLRYFLGDIRDKERLSRAMRNIDTVVHAAALKQVTAAEYNPMEFIKTNICGAENIINAALDNNVKNVVSLSTDKAVSPVNLYGATKLCSDKLMIAANNIKGDKDIKFSVVRYGNVMGSRGSVIPLFIKQASEGKLCITNEQMTRFNISLTEGVDLVKLAINNSLGGEIYVPKLPSYRVKDVAQAIAPNVEHEIIGIRPGEKIHEEMISPADSLNTIEYEKHYLILPAKSKNIINKFQKGKRVESNFCYASNTNKNFLSIDQIRKLIIDNVDSNFVPI